MTDKRKKLTVYLHPEDDSQDARAMEIIESVPLRTRGDFFRAANVGGSALYQLDKRLPYLLSMLFDGQVPAPSVLPEPTVSTEGEGQARTNFKRMLKKD